MRNCYVTMGFGKKTDYATGRTLDLDKAYKYLIKPAVEAAGLECVRADEIVHAGNINVPMYKMLLNADVVIADLSTSNANAIYELGIRHALRPHATIVISERKFRNPFDFGLMAIRTYDHLGEGIDFSETERFRGELESALAVILKEPVTDSPVYTFIRNLEPPRVRNTATASTAMFTEPVPQAHQEEATSRVLIEQAESAMKMNDWDTARALLQAVLASQRRDEPYLIQQLAIATYKSGNPTPQDAIDEARRLLAGLNPGTLNNPDVLAVWGAVHERRWEVAGDRSSLETAIQAYEKAFHLRPDYGNGISLAFLLNARASISDPLEAITDAMLAQRVRREVVRLCEDLLAWSREGNKKLEEEYAVRATLAEAWFGLGDSLKYQAERKNAFAAAPSALHEPLKKRIAELQMLTELSPVEFFAGSVAER